MQTNIVPKIVLQNLAIILWQLYYGKTSFVVLVTEDESM